LKSQQKNFEKLALYLLEKEVIFREDLENIFGKRPFDKEHAIEEPPKVMSDTEKLITAVMNTKPSKVRTRTKKNKTE
jgi:cell division protease FtsH